MGSGTTVELTVRIAKASAGQLDEIVRALEASGLSNLDVHKRLLMINGTAPADAVDALRAIEGVASVRADSTYRTQG